MWCENMLSFMPVHCWQLAQGQCDGRSVSGVVCGVNTCYPSCLYIAGSWLKDSVMGVRCQQLCEHYNLSFMLAVINL